MRKSLLLPLILGLAGCLAGPKNPKHPGSTSTRVIELEPIRITASTSGDTIRSESYDAKQLFEEGTEAFNQGNYPIATKNFRRVFTEFPDSPYALPARYNASLSLESEEKWEEALAGYRELLQVNPDSLPGRFRVAHCLARLGRHAEILETLAPIEARSDLDGQQLIELHARKAQAFFHTQELDKSAEESARALSIYEDIKHDEPLETNYYVSMAQYYDAKVLGEKGRALPIRVNDGKQTLQQDLDDKAEFLLKAQGSFIKVLKLENRQFATMAGYEIGLLYEDFYHQILNAPLPNELTTEIEKQAYIDILTQETRVLLEKALRIYEKNVLLGERVGLKNEFIEQSQLHIQAIKALLEQQNPAPTVPDAPAEDPKLKKPNNKKGDFPGGTKG